MENKQLERWNNDLPRTQESLIRDLRSEVIRLGLSSNSLCLGAHQSEVLDAYKEKLKSMWQRSGDLGLIEERTAIASDLINPIFYPQHTCYHNDRFYVGHVSGLEGSRMRNLATAVIRNGMFDYFEFNTHEGYPLAKLLRDESILEEEEFEDMRRDQSHQRYHILSRRAIKCLAERYELSNDEIEGIAMNLCMAGLFSDRAALYCNDSPFKGGIYGMGSSAGRLRNGDFVENLARTYLKPDLAEAIINRQGTNKK